MRRVFVLAALALGAVTAGGPVRAQEAASTPTVTLREALQRTYEDNPTLAAARAEFRATEELLPQAQAWWKPVVEATAGITYTDIETDPESTADGSTEKSVDLSVNQPLWRGGRTVAQTREADNKIIAKQADLLLTHQDILLDAVSAYMNVVRDQALLDLSRSNEEVIGRQLQASRDRFEVGEITKTDVSQSEARLARAQADRIAAQGDLSTSRAVYEQVVGFPPGRLAEPDISLPLPADFDEAVLQADRASPGVLVARYTYRAAEDAVDTVSGELLPEVGLIGRTGRTWDPSPGLLDEETTSVVGVSATVPLYEAGAVRSRIREAKHTADRRYSLIDEARRAARQSATSAWENLAAARAEIVSRQAQVEAAAVAREGVHKEAEVGSRTILDSLDADQEYLDAQVALVTAKRNEVVARFTLAAALGLLTPDTLGFAALENAPFGAKPGESAQNGGGEE